MGKLAIVLSLLAIVLLLGSIAFHPLGWAFAIGIHPTPAGTPWTYQLLSGFLPAVAVLSLAGNLVTLWRLSTCAAKWCIRPVTHTISGRGWCTRHWQDVKPERSERELLEDILETLKAMVPCDCRAAVPVTTTQGEHHGSQPLIQQPPG